MANLGQDADVAFFNLMHHFMAASGKGESGLRQDESALERRYESRRAFRVTHQIAPGYCWETPPESAWIDVRCHDLTQCGFSFLLDQQPAFDHLVARFGLAEPIYVAGEVHHWRPVSVDAWGGIIEPGVALSGRHAGRLPHRKQVPRRLPVPAALRDLIPTHTVAWGTPLASVFRGLQGSV